MEKIIESLSKLDFFKNIPIDELKEITSEIEISKKSLEKEATILLQGNPYKELYILIEGTAYAEMVDISGKALIIENFKAPYILASALLFTQNNQLPVSVIAMSNVKVIILPKSEILKLCQHNKIFLDNLLSDLANKFDFISKKLKFITFKSIKEKIANYLLSLPRTIIDEVEIPHTIEQLADIFGVTRPSLSRAFIQLEDEGVIKKDNKRVKIIDIEKLKISEE